MIRYKKIISIAILIVIIATTFSTNAFAGGCDSCCSSSKNNANDTKLLKKEKPNITFSLNIERKSFDTEKNCDTEKSCNIERFYELVFEGKGKMDNFSSLTIPPWNFYKNQITSITIREGITSIGDNAFKGCTSLETVIIPKSVTKIGNNAFAECIGLSSITYLGNSDLNDNDAFYDCPKLKKVTVSDTYEGDKFCGKETYKGYTNLDECDTDTSKINSK